MSAMVQCCIPYDEAPPIFTAQQYDSLNQKWEAIKSIVEQHFPKFVLETQQHIDTFRLKLLTGEDIEIFQAIDKTIDGMTNSIKQINLNNRNKALELKIVNLKKVQNEPSPIALPPDTMFIITAKTLSGQIIPLECNGLMPIIEVKKRLYDIIGDPPDQMRIIFKGKQLEDKNLVKDYGICLGDSIHIILRLRGGMFHISTDAEYGEHGEHGELNSVRINCRNYDRGIWSLNYPQNFTSIELRSEIVKTAIKEHIKLPINFTIDVINSDDITHSFSRNGVSTPLEKMKSVTIRF